MQHLRPPYRKWRLPRSSRHRRPLLHRLPLQRRISLGCMPDPAFGGSPGSWMSTCPRLTEPVRRVGSPRKTYCKHCGGPPRHRRRARRQPLEWESHRFRRWTLRSSPRSRSSHCRGSRKSPGRSCTDLGSMCHTSRTATKPISLSGRVPKGATPPQRAGGYRVPYAFLLKASVSALRAYDRERG